MSAASSRVSGAAPVTALTQLAAVIGDPVRHSLSPVIHNAAFRATGVDAVCLALPVAEGEAAMAVEAMRRFGWLGMSVTMPHKAAVIGACDSLTSAAAELGSVNCLFRDGTKIVGANTDGAGFVRGLAAELAVDPSGLVAVVVGAGGAAKAVIGSLAKAGAAEVIVSTRNPDRAALAASLAGPVGLVDDGTAFRRADLVVNATPVGMADTESAAALPFDVGELAESTVVCDLIYHPFETPLLAVAKDRGLRCQNGLAMLVHQAAVAFELWTGIDAPVEVMSQATASAVANS